MPPVLKITQCVLNGLENSLLYMILQRLSRIAFGPVLIPDDPFEHKTITSYHLTP